MSSKIKCKSWRWKSIRFNKIKIGQKATQIQRGDSVNKIELFWNVKESKNPSCKFDTFLLWHLFTGWIMWLFSGQLQVGCQTQGWCPVRKMSTSQNEKHLHKIQKTSPPEAKEICRFVSSYWCGTTYQSDLLIYNKSLTHSTSSLPLQKI